MVVAMAEYSHDVLGVPLDGVGVVVGGGVEPEVVLLLPAADAVGEDVGVERDGLAGDVAEELQVDLVVVRPGAFGDRLQGTRARIERFHVSKKSQLDLHNAHWHARIMHVSLPVEIKNGVMKKQSVLLLVTGMTS